MVEVEGGMRDEDSSLPGLQLLIQGQLDNRKMDQGEDYGV